MNYTQFNAQIIALKKTLNSFTINQIKESLLLSLPIYKKLALDNITDDDVPVQAMGWVRIHDINAIRWGFYGYFDLDGVIEEFEKKIFNEILTLNSKKELVDYFINSYQLEAARQANIEQLQQEGWEVIE